MIKIKWILRLDGLVSLAFGLTTMLAQYAVFNTAVDLATANVTGDGSSVMGPATTSGRTSTACPVPESVATSWRDRLPRESGTQRGYT